MELGNKSGGESESTGNAIRRKQREAIQKVCERNRVTPEELASKPDEELVRWVRRATGTNPTVAQIRDGLKLLTAS